MAIITIILYYFLLRQLSANKHKKYTTQRRRRQPGDLPEIISELFQRIIPTHEIIENIKREHCFICLIVFQHTLTPLTPAVPICCCSKGSVPYWSNPPFLSFDIRLLWRLGLSARATECQRLKMVGWTSMAKCKALTGSVVKGYIAYRILSYYYVVCSFN